MADYDRLCVLVGVTQLIYRILYGMPLISEITLSSSLIPYHITSPLNSQDKMLVKKIMTFKDEIFC
jgi:hypothetical protein